MLLLLTLIPLILVAAALAMVMPDDGARMTHHAFVPTCMKSGQGLSAPRMELACLCLWNDGIGRIDDPGLRARILWSYRRHDVLAFSLDRIAETERAQRTLQTLTATYMQCATKAAAARA